MHHFGKEGRVDQTKRTNLYNVRFRVLTSKRGGFANFHVSLSLSVSVFLSAVHLLCMLGAGFALVGSEAGEDPSITKTVHDPAHIRSKDCPTEVMEAFRGSPEDHSLETPSTYTHYYTRILGLSYYR